MEPIDFNAEIANIYRAALIKIDDLVSDVYTPASSTLTSIEAVLQDAQDEIQLTLAKLDTDETP